jgi:TatD DNase family protein
MGIHPRFINEETLGNDWQLLQLSSHQQNVFAIGECGLDRLCDIPFHLQEKVFVMHIRWANEIAKPLIIHCVRAFPETIRLLKSCNNKMPVVFHGFNNNKEIAEQLLKEGYYLSFGKSLLQPNMENLFNHIPLNKIFLENDDSDIAISSIYEQAARIKQMPVETMAKEMKKNLFTVFNISTT